MTPRIHLPALADQPASPVPSGPLPLDEPAAHHLLRVLRRGIGDEIEVFDGQGRCWRAQVASTKPATVTLLAALPAEPPPRLRLGLAQCLGTAEKMDWTIEKAVELGVSHIVPLLSARSVVKLDGARAEKRVQHWQRLVVAAAMQCGRSRLPEIAPILPVGTWLASLSAPQTHERRWVLSPLAESSLMAQAGALAAPIGTPLAGDHQDQPGDATASEAGTTAWLLCGPESGLAETEVDQALSHGWQPALLGPRVLRTETAGLVGLTVLQAALGDLG